MSSNAPPFKHGGAPSGDLGARVDLSVVAPAHNEEENVRELVGQVEAAVAPLGRTWEFVLVDDGSTDRTRAIAMELAESRPWLR
ncbi:MAG: glycosyltransferase [Phycisphaerales bacterium]